MVSRARTEVVQTLAHDRGRLTGYHSETADPNVKPVDVVYIHDADGRVSQETHRGGMAAPVDVTYKYDAQGRLVEKIRDHGRSKIITTYRYDCKK